MAEIKQNPFIIVSNLISNVYDRANGVAGSKTLDQGGKRKRENEADGGESSKKPKYSPVEISDDEESLPDIEFPISQKYLPNDETLPNIQFPNEEPPPDIEFPASQKYLPNSYYPDFSQTF